MPQCELHIELELIRMIRTLIVDTVLPQFIASVGIFIEMLCIDIIE